MQKNSIQAYTLHDTIAPSTSRLPGEQRSDPFVDTASPLPLDAGLDSGGIATSTPEPLSDAFILAARLFNVFPDADRCDGDSYEEDDNQGFMGLFRSRGEGQMHMNKELFERLELGVDVDDLLLLTTLMGQQQDPNANMNFLNVLILSKLLGRGGHGRGIETALLLSQMMNANPQAPSGGIGVQSPMQNNMLPLLLALSIGRGEEGEGMRGIGRRGWRDKDEYPEAVPEKKQPRQ